MALTLHNKIVIIADTPNEYGVTYPRDTLLKLCEDPEKEYHGSFINVDTTDESKTAIVAKNLKMSSNVLLGDFTILDTPYGAQLQKLMQEHHFALTPHGYGVVDEDGIVSDYELHNINIKLT